jgi:hypothetical protein
MEKSLYMVGSFVARFPIRIWIAGFSFYVAVGLAGWLQLKDPDDSFTDVDFKLLWSDSSSSIGTEVATFLEHHGGDDPDAKAAPFVKSYHFTMMVHREERGTDIMTPEGMDEAFSLYKKFFDIKVTTKSGLMYTTQDLCDRGGTPDNPSMPVEMPCMISDPFQCFSEYLEATPASYQQYIDPYIDDPPMSNIFASIQPKSFKSRPSWKNMTASQIKKEVSSGCSAWTKLAQWPAMFWGGGVHWNSDKTEILRLGGMAWILFYDGYRRAAFRMSLTQPEKAKESEVKEAINLHKQEWSKMVENFDKNEAKLIETSNLKPGFINEIVDNAEEVPWGLLVAGSVMMMIMVFLTHFRLGDTRFSRAQLAGHGLTCVLLTVVGGSGLLLLFMRYNASMIAALPLLALGLGLDDMFVLTRYFNDVIFQMVLGKPPHEDKPEPHEIVGRVFQEAGPGVLLTSCVNAISFAMGAMIPIPGLAQFCIGASVTSALNFFSIIVLFLPFMCLEIHRIDKRWPEYLCYNVPEYRESLEDKFTKWLENRAAPFIMKKMVRYSIIFLFLAIFIAMVISIIMLKSTGYSPKQLAREGTIDYLGLEHCFEMFGSFPAFLVFKDVDVPNKQAEMLKVYDHMTRTDHTAPHAIMPYVTMTSLIFAGQLDDSYTHPTFAPKGVFKPGSAEKWYTAFNWWRAFPTNATAVVEAGQLQPLYTLADLVFTNEFTYTMASSEFGGSTLDFSFFPFFIVDLQEDAHFIKAIRAMQDVTDDEEKNPLGRQKAYPYSDIITFWSVFLQIEPIMWRSLAINTCVLFVLTACLLKDIVVALVTVLICTMIVLGVYGVMMTFVQYNTFVATGLIACSGLAVEDVAHFVAAFNVTKGDTQKKLATAMKHTFVAIILGSLSTFFSLLPLAFHYMDFIVLYQFAMFVILVVIGLTTGTVFLPAVMATYGLCREKLTPSANSSGGSNEEVDESAAYPNILNSAPPSTKNSPETQRI